MSSLLCLLAAQLRKINLSGGPPLYCMWVSKDYEEELSQAMDLSLSRNTPKDLRYSQMVSGHKELVAAVYSSVWCVLYMVMHPTSMYVCIYVLYVCVCTYRGVIQT